MPDPGSGVRDAAWVSTHREAGRLLPWLAFATDPEGSPVVWTPVTCSSENLAGDAPWQAYATVPRIATYELVVLECQFQ